ncbi:hypothetical protein GFS31_10300 [Leptolyngbya sp. BL0902]|uniref:nuclear transport factor 2 family protein n=1 Tax=Leptolyngbya sp. BL0902 TaxID=1115757 RepID=UPI0018E8E8C6|nr:nuclear transport factor 2 family protein [Leptolyngbya sp. BL0902]QQE64350.1 hypothetical protein GFS31_10300 [Leptolyngbya sp. BL0902]
MGQCGVGLSAIGRMGGLAGSAWVLTLGLGSAPAWAATATTAPAAVRQTLERIETAANAQDLEAVMAAYSTTFTSDTGFDHSQLRQTLETFWQQYSTLTYEVELLSWEAAGPGTYTLETRTQVNGVQVLPDRRLNLTADVTSRQRLENGQIVRQDTLSETSRITSGTNPPTLQTLLPNRLSPGQSFAFDTIVMEPLEGRSLMGVAVDEGVTAIDFFEPRPVVFDVLSAGGLYRVGTAPSSPDQRWISAVIIREDGMVVETRRVPVD